MNRPAKFYAWLAGLLEGEGNFQAHNTNHPQIKLAMTDEDVVARVADALGRRYYRKERPPDRPNWKPCYVVSICGSDAIGLMMALYPLLGARRRDKIRELLALWRPIRNGNFNRDKMACKNGHPFTTENIYKRKDNNGLRDCLTCRRSRNERFSARRKAERLAIREGA